MGKQQALPEIQKYLRREKLEMFDPEKIRLEDESGGICQQFSCILKLLHKGAG